MADPARTPALDRFFGYGAMVPIVATAALALAVPPHWSPLFVHCGIVWSGAILAFLGGVRRGLSFNHPDGPTTVQLATMLWLFALGFLALLSPVPIVSIILLFVGFLSVALLDPVAAQHEEAPRFFRHLRPPQMLLGLVGLLLLCAAVLLRT